MKLCLLAVALALFCTVHGFSEDPEARKKVEGTWTALAISSNDPKIMNHMDKMKAVEVEVSFVNGDVVIETRFPTPKGCRPFKMVFKKGDDGKYYHKCGFGEKKVEVVETDGETHAIVDVIAVRDDQTTFTSSLYARDAESVPAGLVERFVRRSEEKGLNSENTKVFPKGIACQNEAA